jgi:hypothetical protein
VWKHRAVAALVCKPEFNDTASKAPSKTPGRPRLLFDPNYLPRSFYEAAVTGVAGAAGATGAFVFDPPALTAETAFLAGADFFAAFAETTFFAAFRTLTQWAFWAAAILARTPALKVRLFVLFARKLAVVAFFAADAAAVLCAAFLAAFLDFAQRAFCAAAIFARASALNVRLVLALPGNLVVAGRLGFRFSVVLVPVNSAFTCCSLDISASISTTMSCIFMNPPVLRINHRMNVPSPDCCLSGFHGRNSGGSNRIPRTASVR